MSDRILPLVSWPIVTYLRHSPIEKGKWRLLQMTSEFLVTDIGPGVFAFVDGPVGRPMMQGVELDEQRHFLSRIRAGMTIFDLGANIGIYTMGSAKLAGTLGSVHAFEPNPAVAKRLRRNLQLNGFKNVVVNEIALCERVGKVTFHVHEEDVCSSLGAVAGKCIGSESDLGRICSASRCPKG
jgi:hypothetical protein